MQEYWDTRSLERQRDYHLHHVNIISKVRPRAAEDRAKEGEDKENQCIESRRTHTYEYFLGTMKVRKIMYLRTLGISEQVVRTAFAKKGIECAQKDNRGGGTTFDSQLREIGSKSI